MSMRAGSRLALRIVADAARASGDAWLSLESELGTPTLGSPQLFDVVATICVVVATSGSPPAYVDRATDSRSVVQAGGL
jgi:hypothetical protein